jgi:peptidyl-prolyl cis-trans isomerase C
MMNTMTDGGCGGSCTCGGQQTATAEAPIEDTLARIAPALGVAAPAPTINGVALHADGAIYDAESLHELACAELLRQRAVELRYLPAMDTAVAPELDDAARLSIEAMLDAEVPAKDPTDLECRRHYDANLPQFRVGQSLKVRHILFAVTSGVDVQKLIRRAEDALHALSKNDASPERFAQLAAELSNCPSGAQGGELGWITPADLSPELARELFFKPETGLANGLQPRLIHSRFGLHIIDVTEQNPGRLPTFDEVRQQIASRLTLRSRATALGQYMRLLAGGAEVVGIELASESSPLVQ